MTPPERRLWNVLKARPGGFKFRRQHPLGPYTLDFFCYEAALAVELDGLAHELGSNPQRDIRRDKWVAEQGVHTLRFRATDVRDNLEGVLIFIAEECLRRSPRERGPSTSFAGPPPLQMQGRIGGRP
jgi:very-short-patch-repair endonuclease